MYERLTHLSFINTKSITSLELTILRYVLSIAIYHFSLLSMADSESWRGIFYLPCSLCSAQSPTVCGSMVETNCPQGDVHNLDIYWECLAHFIQFHKFLLSAHVLSLHSQLIQLGSHAFWVVSGTETSTIRGICMEY